MDMITNEISLNDRVMVKLTEHGKWILDNYRREAERGIQGQIMHAYRYDEKGRYTALLWHIIAVFGSYIYAGNRDVFEDNKFYLIEDIDI